MPVKYFHMPLAAVLVLLVSAGAADAQQRRIILKKEPPDGSLRAGRTVLVDDGSCPAGQIKQVIGGKQADGSRRRRICIERR